MHLHFLLNIIVVCEKQKGNKCTENIVNSIKLYTELGCNFNTQYLKEKKLTNILAALKLTVKT